MHNPDSDADDQPSIGKIRIYIEFGCLQLSDESHLPTPKVVQWNVNNPIIVGWYLDVSLGQGADSISTKGPSEIPKFKNHILSCTRFEIGFLTPNPTLIIRRQQDHSKPHFLGMLLELLDYRLASIRLLTQYHWLEFQRFKKISPLNLLFRGPSHEQRRL